MSLARSTRSARGEQVRLSTGARGTQARQIVTLPVVGPIERREAAIIGGALFVLVLLMTVGGGESQRITIT